MTRRKGRNIIQLLSPEINIDSLITPVVITLREICQRDADKMKGGSPRRGEKEIELNRGAREGLAVVNPPTA